MEFSFTNPHGEKLDHSYHPSTSDTTRMVVIGHGVTANKDRVFLQELAKGLSAHGFHALRFSFSGNGQSEGKFTESTISKEVEDLGSVLDQLDKFQVAFVGHSMGGAVGVLRTAKDDRIRTMVSLAGMVHTAEFVERKFGDLTPGKDLMWDKPECPLSQEFMDDARKIDTVLPLAKVIQVPWLLIHGTADTVVLPKDSHDVMEATGNRPHLEIIEGADHLFNGEAVVPMVEKCTQWLGENFTD